MVCEAPLKPAIVEGSAVAAAIALNSVVDLALIVTSTVISVDSNLRPEFKYVLSICTSPTGIPNIAAIWYLNCDIAAAMSPGLESVVTAFNVPRICTARAITAVHTSDMFAYPDEHAQLLTDELAFGELEFAGHAMHAVAFVAPSVAEYVPARQLVQTLALLAPAVAEYVPARQLVQTVALLAPAK